MQRSEKGHRTWDTFLSNAAMSGNSRQQFRVKAEHFATKPTIRGLQRPAVAAAGCIPAAMGRGGCKYLQEHGYGCGHGCELATDFSKINSEPKITLCLVKEKYGPSGFQNSKIF